MRGEERRWGKREEKSVWVELGDFVDFAAMVSE